MRCMQSVAVRRDTAGPVEVGFVGRLSTLPQGSGPQASQATAERALQQVAEREVPVAVNRQVHSRLVVDASEAPAEADGLIVRASASTPIALCVFTADCVPVLVANAEQRRLAALHAGWRGLASGIIEVGVHKLGGSANTGSLTAWIGPTIGPCCYEVSDEVAVAVAESSGPTVVFAPPSPPTRPRRPHLDLVRAAALQLERAGVDDIRRLTVCTRCDPGWHSYRRDGAGGGRNHALIWTTPD